MKNTQNHWQHLLKRHLVRTYFWGSKPGYLKPSRDLRLGGKQKPSKPPRQAPKNYICLEKTHTFGGFFGCSLEKKKHTHFLASSGVLASGRERLGACGLTGLGTLLGERRGGWKFGLGLGFRGEVLGLGGLGFLVWVLGFGLVWVKVEKCQGFGGAGEGGNELVWFEGLEVWRFGGLVWV